MNEEDTMSVNEIVAELRLLVQCFDELAQDWGDEGCFRTYRDKLRFLTRKLAEAEQEAG